MSIKILGIKIYISYFFFAIITLILLTDKTGLCLHCIITVILHELGHLIVMKICGNKLKEIKLIPGSIQIVNSKFAKFSSEITVMLAGSFVNILIYLTFSLFELSKQNYNLYYFAILNLFVGIFNLLPLYGLDGGSIIICVLNKYYPEIEWRRIIANITVVVSVIVFIAGFYFSYNEITNISFVIIGIYFFIASLLKI